MTTKQIEVIDMGWYRRNHVSRALPKPPQPFKSPRQPRPRVDLSRAEQALLEYRRASTSEHLSNLSELVTANQLGLCFDCLREHKLRAVPKMVVTGRWTDLQVVDVVGLCQACRKVRQKTHEIHSSNGELVIFDKEKV